jgi:hypothetical protein
MLVIPVAYVTLLRMVYFGIVEGQIRQFAVYYLMLGLINLIWISQLMSFYYKSEISQTTVETQDQRKYWMKFFILDYMT